MPNLQHIMEKEIQKQDHMYKAEIIITDPEKIIIKKIRTYSITFSYEDDTYLLHGSADGYETSQSLFRKTYRDDVKGGYWLLEELKSRYLDEDVAYEYIRSIYGMRWNPKTTFTLKHTDKVWFVRMLVKNGFALYLHDINVKERNKKYCNNKANKKKAEIYECNKSHISVRKSKIHQDKIRIMETELRKLYERN